MSRAGGRCVCKDKSGAATVKYSRLDPALCVELRKITEAMTAPGKGLLAADESPASLEARFQEIGLENTEANRRDYRQMLFSADKSQMTQYISGVILHHETLNQKTAEDVEFPEFLRQRNLIPGIKVDKGCVPLFGTNDENTTQGLDDLQERCIQYKKQGCHFAKWRCTFHITDTLPSQLALIENANVLARYASICQSARIVPIVEPEVLTTGDHPIETCQSVHEKILSHLFRSLDEHHVCLEGMILKPAMILPGADNDSHCTPQIIAEKTVTTLQRTVPPAVPAVLFLSGGQTDEDSVANLNAINVYEGPKPWVLSFCYGRALQNTPMKVWSGNSKQAPEAQRVFLTKAKACSLAALGKWELADNVGEGSRAGGIGVLKCNSGGPIR